MWAHDCLIQWQKEYQCGEHFDTLGGRNAQRRPCRFSFSLLIMFVFTWAESTNGAVAQNAGQLGWYQLSRDIWIPIAHGPAAEAKTSLANNGQISNSHQGREGLMTTPKNQLWKESRDLLQLFLCRMLVLASLLWIARHMLDTLRVQHQIWINNIRKIELRNKCSSQSSCFCGITHTYH